MHNKLVAALFSVLFAFGFGHQAYAQTASNSGLYGSLSGAYNFFTQNQDAEETTKATGAKTPFEVDFDDGWGGIVTLGYNFGGARLELEGGYKENDIDNLSVGAFGVGGAFVEVDGEVQTLSGMINLILDLPVEGKLQPFILGGIGLANHEVDISRIANTAVNFKDDDTVLTYQVGAGLAYQLGESADLLVQYRYMSSEDVTVEDATATDEFDYNHHAVMIGLRFGF